jgi:hypothetical protein
MEKYKTPNGNIVSADDLRNQYGGRFDDLVKNGTFVLVEETTEAEKKNQVGTPSTSEEVVTESTTEITQPTIPGSSDSSENIPDVEPTETQEEFDIFSDEGQSIIEESTNNTRLLDSVGFKFIYNFLPDVEPTYNFIEDGKEVSKKASEIDSKVLDVIKIYEKANKKIDSENYLDVKLNDDDYDNIDNVGIDVLINNNISNEEFLKWEKKNTRQENSAYKFFKSLLTSDEGDEYEKEKRAFEKIQSFKAYKLNRVTDQLSRVQAAIKITTNPEEIKELKKQEKQLTGDFYKGLNGIQETIKSFPKYKQYSEDEDLRRRKEFYNAVKQGGVEEFSEGTQELVKTGTMAVVDFATGFFSAIPGIIDQRLSDEGYDEKGLLAGLSEMFTDSAKHVETEIGQVKRSGFIEGKPVTYRGEKYIVDTNGTVFDSHNIRMDGIISKEDIRSIQERSKTVPNTEMNFTGGTVVQGLTSTLMNLYGLIRTGGKVNKAMGLEKYMKAGTAGKLGMGISSFASSVTGNVDDIRSQLMASGMSEKKAMGIAVNAGQLIATLDGIFSGLAGSNQKLLKGFQGIKEQIKNLALKKGSSKFTRQQFLDKGKDLLKENAKELGIEELPVLFSERGINYLINEAIGKQVLNQKVTLADGIETAVMTIGATSTLGSKKLLSGNKRADLVRVLANDVENLQETLDVLVKEGSLSKKEAMNAYTEIYNMQTAVNKTKGTILVSTNMEEASDLLSQRQNLISQKEGLEGPGKRDIDSRIADVDAQLDALYEKDKIEAKAIIKSEQEGEVEVTVTDTEVLEALKAEGIESPTEQQKIKKSDELLKIKQDAISKPSTEEKVLQDDAGSEKEGGDSQVELRQVGEGDVESDTTQTKEEESETQTDTASDTITQTDTEQLSILNKSINVTDSSGKKGLVPVSELESFVGENRLGDAAMPNSRERIDKLKEDIKKNGFKEPIVVLYDKFSNGGEATIIEGNHRYAAAKELGLKEIPVTFEKGTIRSNEKRVKDQMFPLNRKSIGKINDTFGVKGSDLGLTVRQPNDADFVKDEVMSVNKERVDSIVDGIVEKTKSRNVGESTNPQKVADNAIEYLKGSKLFEQATDTERETILRDVSKKLGVEIKAPTAKKLLGIKRMGKPTTIKVKSDYAALKKDLRKEQKIARDAKNDVNKRRKGLQGAIDAVLKAGNITTKKANSLLKKVSNVNLYNAKKVQDVIDFTEKAMNDAEYSSKLDKANKLQKVIKKKLKGKEAGLSDAAKEFVKVNPSNVSDIDNYLEKAEAVSKGLQPTRKPSKGDLKVTKPFDIKKITEYSKKEVEAEAIRNYELAKESFQELTGLEAGDLTLEQLREALNELEGEKKTAEFEKEKKKTIDKAVENAFKNTKINIKGAIESGDIKVTKEQKTLINNFLNMDLNLMTTKQKMEALDSIVNFELNQSTGGMEAVLKKQKGVKELTYIQNKGFKTPKNPKLWGLGPKWNKYISTLPNLFELSFKSQQKGRMVMNALGLNGIINGSAKAQTQSAQVEKDYANAFAKKKMQDGIYFDESNDTERAILAEARRYTPGTEAEQQKEFDDSKNLIKETYERLMASGDKLKVKKGEIVKKQYEKLLKDSKTIAEVESKADPVNLQGVEYVTDIWSEKYNELADVSLNIYNRNLGKDVNYTPRNIRSVTQVEPEIDITQPVFNPEGLERKNVYDKKTGVLKEATKPSTLQKGKVLNLSFDSQNMSNYKAALTDIYTASSIQQVKGARESKAFNEVFTDPEARDVINKRINKYVATKRGKNYIDGKDRRTLNRLNKIATLGVSRVLGGPTQLIKQIVPIFNTGVNAGVINTFEGAKLMFNPDVRKAINNSGLPIANRGISSQTDLESTESRIAKKANTKQGRFLDNLDNINKKTLEYFLVTPDVATAKASFIAYYLNAMNKKGVKTSEVDFTKPLDKEAAQFAQQQVDRQQNTSDQDLQGDLFNDQKLSTQIIRKTLFPFANFLLNQKTRMYSDINTLYNNPTALPGDKKRARQSLAGLGLETTVFNLFGLGITQALSALARVVSGEDEDDPNLSKEMNDRKRRKAEEKDFMNRVKGRTGNMIADVVSPVPILNDILLNNLNVVMEIFQEDEENPWKFFAKTDKGIKERLGVLGIGGKKLGILADMIQTIVTGEKTTEYMGKKSTKKIEPKKLKALQGIAMAYTFHLIGVPGLNSSEVGYISERAFKNISKMTPKEEKFVEEKKRTSLKKAKKRF